MAMQGVVMHANVGAVCTHAPTAQLRITPTQTRVQVSGQPVATATATLTVAGCPGVNGVFCAVATWRHLSTRVLVGGQPVLLQAPAPLVPPALGEAFVAGPPPNQLMVMSAQPRVVAK